MKHDYLFIYFKKQWAAFANKQATNARANVNRKIKAVVFLVSFAWIVHHDFCVGIHDSFERICCSSNVYV
jgi:hypothetical protein